MPRVNDTYKIKKKEEILNAASNILSKKTLYEISMTDVIKEAGISKGGIYLYYKDIDELIIDVMEREFRADTFQDRIDTLFLEDCPMDRKFHNLLRLYAMYIEESPILAGKMQFELSILFTQNSERALKIRDRISISKTGAYFYQKIAELIMSNLKDTPKLQEHGSNIISFVHCFLDGALEIYVFDKCYHFKQGHIKIDKMAEMLAGSIVQMIEDSLADK